MEADNLTRIATTMIGNMLNRDRGAGWVTIRINALPCIAQGKIAPHAGICGKGGQGGLRRRLLDHSSTNATSWSSEQSTVSAGTCRTLPVTKLSAVFWLSAPAA